MIRRGLASWKTQLALVAVALAVVLAAPLASPKGVGGRRHRGRALAVGSTVHWLPAASAGADSAGRSSPGLQRSARHARPGHPDAVRPVRGRRLSWPRRSKTSRRRTARRRRRSSRATTSARARSRAHSSTTSHRRRLKPDARRRRFGRKPRVRRGLRRTASNSERRLPSTDGCTAAPYALASGGPANVYPGADFQYLSANVVGGRQRQALVPGLRHEAVRVDGRQEVKVGIIGEVLESTPTIVTPLASRA